MPIKLKEGIPSTSMKIIELYNKIDSDRLDTQPDFQRKLVWKKQHKYHFIETILLNYPFPEIYIASAEMDVENLTAREIVVDGQQRLTTIVDYIKGINDFANQQKITPFDQLSNDEKKAFLNYVVTVKDLKDMNHDVIKEVFKRINNTEYSLNAVEKTNAQYGDGEFAIFCKQLVDSNYKVTNDDTDIVLDESVKKKLNEFFETYEIFNENDRSRMFDLQYSMQLVSTILERDYYHRNSKVEEYLRIYNSRFEHFQVALEKMLNAINIISVLELPSKSYWYNKANLFTLIIELSKEHSNDLDLIKLETNLRELENKNDIYYSEEDSDLINEEEKKYFEAARQGVNDKASRLQRARVVAEIICNSRKEAVSIGMTSLAGKNVETLKQKELKFIAFPITKTALDKYNIDAVSSIREFLSEMKIHDFSLQKNGAEFKINKNVKIIISADRIENEQISFYKANARGDARIWISHLQAVASPSDILAIIVKNDHIYIFNLSKLDFDSVTI